jgi:Flp pilus assembly protein TadB
MTTIAFALLFALGLFISTFSLFLPATSGRRAVVISQRVGKGSLPLRLIDAQRQFLFECGLGNRLPVSLYLLVRVVAGVLVFFVVRSLLGDLVGVVGGAFGFLAVRWFIIPIRAARMKAVTEGVIDFGHAFVALLKAGSQPHEAIAVLAGPSGPPAMRSYLVILAHEIRTDGMARAMVKSIDRVADPLFDTLATAILVQSEKGAELAEALQVTIKNIEQGAILIRRASSLKMQATIAALITPIMICALVFGFQLHDGRAGGYFSYYYTTPLTNPPGFGQIIEVAVLGLFIAGYFIMKKIQEIPPPPRVKLRER